MSAWPLLRTPISLFNVRGGGFYKIPKSLNNVLYDVRFDDSAGVISFKESTYIVFDEKNIYLDVTTEEKMREAGVERTDSIVVA